MASSTKTVQAAQPRPEHPRPDMQREQWLNLNGSWEFEIDAGNSGEERGLVEAESLKQKITVPFCPESELSGIGNKDFMAAVWYRRTFEVPAEWKDQRVLLHFGAVDYDSTVWVNGQKAGTHRGGFSSFQFDITKHLKAGANVLVVRAVDDTRSPLVPKGKQSNLFKSHGCSYTRTTGIWQTVWLEAVPTNYIKSVKCFPQVAQGRVTFQVNVNGALSGGKLTAEISAEGKQVAKTQIPASGSATITVDLPEVKLWEPLKPYLYDVTFTLEGKGQQADNVKSYFGMRDIQIDGKKVLINGKSVFQRLILDQGFYPDGIYTAPTEEALKRDIQLSLDMGFNGARLHQKVFEPRFLYWADKMGYMVWGEYASWGLDNSRMEGLERVLTEWVEVLERDFNHPALVGWCPFNETNPEQNAEMIRLVYETTKLVDPTRPVIDTSGYVHVKTDIYDCHNYEQDPAKFAALFEEFKTVDKVWRNYGEKEADYLGQPYFVSEYGGIWWAPQAAHERSWGYGERPKTEQEVLDRYRGLTNALLSHPRMFAFCYTQLTDVEQEENGLYTYDRKAKFDPKIIREINMQPAAIEKE